MQTQIEVKSPNVIYDRDYITAKCRYFSSTAVADGNKITVTPGGYDYTFKTSRKVKKTGMMLVGWGGNNGSTVTGAVLANRYNLSWKTKAGIKKPDYFGSLTQSTTVRLGMDPFGKELYAPLTSLLPMVHPNDLVIGGWDINDMNLADAMERACVFDSDLQRQLKPLMENLRPLPSIYYPDFIAANQGDRANNVIQGKSKQEDLEHIRMDIKHFKKVNQLECCIILWTANTERFTDVKAGLNTTADEVLSSIKNNEEEISPSQLFAVAAILEGCPYINGSPQNTFVPGIIELAEQHGVFIAGDDFKSGQTKMKSVLVDFLVKAGIKPESIVSYNHLGNNDGKNLSAPSQFRSKEISKSNVVDDMVDSNRILYEPDEHPDHCVVIKYVPFVKDSKRAMDEYTSRIFMGGLQTIVMHNTCEDSLLASPLILDLVILTELCTRIQYKTPNLLHWEHFDSVLSILSYMLKAPLVPPGTPVINALGRQQRCIVNILKACIGLPADSDMLLETRTQLPKPIELESLEHVSSSNKEFVYINEPQSKL